MSLSVTASTQAFANAAIFKVSEGAEPISSIPLPFICYSRENGGKRGFIMKLIELLQLVDESEYKHNIMIGTHCGYELTFEVKPSLVFWLNPKDFE